MLAVPLALLFWSVAADPACAAAQKAGAAQVVWSEADWLGRSREDVVATLGRPLSALQRGDTEVLMYAKNVRIEIRADEVISYRAGSGPAIVASDGTRYNATDRGRVQRVAPKPADDFAEEFNDEAPAPTEVARSGPPAPAHPSLPARNEPAVSSTEAAPEDEDAEPEAASDEDPLVADEDMGTFDADEAAPDSVHDEDLMHPISEAIEDLSERGMGPGAGEEEQEPLVTRVISGAIHAVLRFGFAVLMLRISISWVGLPSYMPDVCKVAALYVVVREGMHGLATFGGHWEWIALFRLDDGVSLLALAILLFRFKIALSGLTALKIAVATKFVTYFLMLIVGVALSFTLG